MSNRSKKIKRAKLISGTVLMVLFLLLIAALKIIDVQPIGPQGSEVGFATLNGAFHRLTGVNMTWYDITGALGMAASHSRGVRLQPVWPLAADKAQEPEKGGSGHICPGRAVYSHWNSVCAV